MNGGGTCLENLGEPAGPPQEALDACVGLSNGDECRFTSPRGDMVMGTCGLTADDRLACMPADGPPPASGDRQVFNGHQWMLKEITQIVSAFFSLENKHLFTCFKGGYSADPCAVTFYFTV